MLACVWASERWHLYLYGQHLVPWMDHQALTTLLRASGSDHKHLHHRWGERVRQYDYELKFTLGRDNVVAVEWESILYRVYTTMTQDIG